MQRVLLLQRNRASVAGQLCELRATYDESEKQRKVRTPSCWVPLVNTIPLSLF